MEGCRRCKLLFAKGLVLLAAALTLQCAVPEPPTFDEAAERSGLRFHHVNGMTGEFFLAEMMGGGVALLDYDGDGDLDVFLVQGGSLPPEPDGPGDRLFRNDLEPGHGRSRGLRFTDVTEQAGIDGREYGMGVSAADVDNDGDTDLYVTNFGPNRLWLNNGDGTFRDGTAASGTDDPRWSVPAAFFDYDRDGWLDLFVGNYVDFTLARNKPCYSKVRDYCSPSAYRPLPDRLFRNRGAGRFEDVGDRVRLSSEYGPALGAVSADFDEDGWPDLYVANDGEENLLWRNVAGETFENLALIAGCALNAAGEAEASMGVDAEDFDGDGDLDLFLTHLAGETNTLYVNQGSAVFHDRTLALGLGATSRSFTGFGTAWIDYDNDGRLDLLAVNGAVTAIDALVAAGDPFPLHQTNQLFRNTGDGFVEVTAGAQAAFRHSEVSRGAALGDLDNDGDVDIVVANNNGPVRLLLNRNDGRAGWIGASVVQGDPPRAALGARIALHRPGAPPVWRRVRTDASYASASDPRVVFGLADASEVDGLAVRWPDGSTEWWDRPEPRRWHVLRRGEGRSR